MGNPEDTLLSLAGSLLLLRLGDDDTSDNCDDANRDIERELLGTISWGWSGVARRLCACRLLQNQICNSQTVRTLFFLFIPSVSL